MLAWIMRRVKFAPLALLAIALNAGTAEDPFKRYPGATLYTAPETQQNKLFASALRPGIKITAYVTNDSFENVVAFYRAIGKEYTPGQKKAFLILDGAQDLVSSREWLSRPASVRGRSVGQG